MAATPEKTDTNNKAPRTRSPMYPFISLRKALERAREFHKTQHQHATPIRAAVGVWEFGAKSSGGLQTVSALKQFGLMSDSEDDTDVRKVRLTDSALAIIRDEREPSPDREAALKKAALLPKIYAEMWQKWEAQLPNDATIKLFLTHEKKYNETAAPELIASYKDTLAFAKLIESDKTMLAEGESGHKGVGDNQLPTPSPALRKGAKLVEGERELTTGLLSKTASFRLIVTGDVGVKEIERLIAKLQLDKEILADQDSDDKPT